MSRKRLYWCFAYTTEQSEGHKVKRKFSIGDKVRLRGKGKWRVPDYVRKGLHSRTRTVVDLHYDEKLKAVLYDLGGRGKGVEGYLFRSYQLVPSQRHAPIGRPRQKRRYQRRSR